MSGSSFGCKEQGVKNKSLTFPNVVESKLLRPDTDHAPRIEQNDANRHGVEHSLRGKAEAFLDLPEGEDTHGLSSYAHDEEVREVESVVCDN